VELLYFKKYKYMISVELLGRLSNQLFQYAGRGSYFILKTIFLFIGKFINSI